MHDSAKYLIHADIRASGVVERSDVVGAVFGQTEGLLGDELDLRDLQESQKLGRIDVEIRSEAGQSFGEITIASGLDRVETAILAAALESIERVGPCRADVEVTELEDVRSAKRREIVDRATELLADFDETALSSQDIVEEVREAVRVEDITDFHGLPAGPRVGETDAIIVVEGRADVLTLLRYGVKNAIAVEGTDVPEEVARLTSELTVTAFLDGDRGGDLILKELAQVGDIDHVALAPPGRSVEDLSRDEVLSALREKVPFEAVDGEPGAEVLAATDGSATPAPEGSTESGESGPVESATTTSPDASSTSPQSSASPQSPPSRTAVDGANAGADPDGPADPEAEDAAVDAAGSGGAAADRTPPSPGDDADGTVTPGASAATDSPAGADTTSGTAASSDDEDPDAGDADGEAGAESTETLAGHVADVVESESGLVRALDESFGVLAEEPATDAFDMLADVEQVPTTVVLDGELSQRVLDVAAQRGVEQVVVESEGEYVKQPASVRIRTVGDGN